MTAGYFWDGFTTSLFLGMTVAGMIGHVFKRKMAFKIIWRYFFYAFSFLMLIGFLWSTESRFLFLLLLTYLPAWYALHAYVYRSRDIWKKQ